MRSTLLDAPLLQIQVSETPIYLVDSGLISSSFVHKRAGEKIKAGPIWDQNLALGVFGDMISGEWCDDKLATRA